ncbi:unnamed protein product, partial [Didymodactylos carnosus]
GLQKRIPSPLFHNLRVIGPRESMREESLEKAQQELNSYEQQIDSLRQQLNSRDADHEQNLMRLKAQTTGESRTNLQENIDMIRLQRDLREKSDESRRLQTQCSNLESQNQSLQMTNSELLKEIDRLDRQIKDEQQRAVQLRTELRNGSRSNTLIYELNAQIDDLRRECEVLKEANTKLVNSAFNADREREFREKERALKLQIAQLEATLKADLGERGTLLDRLTLEKESNKKTDDEHRTMHLKYLEMKEKYDDLAEKLRFFEREGDVNMKEIEEALIILRQRKQKQEPNFDFLQKVDEEKGQNLQHRLRELESQLAETSNELEKTRNLLFMQYKINRDYKLEVDCIQKKMDENQADFSSRTLEHGQLLDIRADRIRNLEKQLRDVAYGTRQYRVQEYPSQSAIDNDFIENAIELERGKNLIEIHLSRGTFSDKALEYLGSGNDPSTFCSIEFFEHELQITPIVKGRTPEYDFTAQYIVNVDDFLLYYLQKEYTVVELHQALGQTYRTVAVCKLNLKQLIEGSHGRLHSTVKLTGSNEDNMDIMNFGSIEYWVRLQVPMEQAFRLLKERMKAQGYLVTNKHRTTAQENGLDMNEQQTMSEQNMNELNIAILNCSNVRATSQDRQPDLYCVYKFFNFTDRDTAIRPSSNNPNFDDRASYPVHMDADLDRYLKNTQLTIFVFDDKEQIPEHYAARADIPLLPLSHDNDIKGTFDMRDHDGNRNGTMDVILKWTNTYIPPPSSTRTPAQKAKGYASPREPLALMPYENAASAQTIAEKARETNVRLTSRDIITNRPHSDTEQNNYDRQKPDIPRSSHGIPASSRSRPTDPRLSNTRPPVNVNNNHSGKRSSSAGSGSSKRVSFDNPDDNFTNEPPRFSTENQSIDDETSRPATPESIRDETTNRTTMPDESDPDIIYQTSISRQPNTKRDNVTIGVHELVLNDKCPIFDDENCEKVFVSVEFLNYTEELETPYSLQKRDPNVKYSFNFQKGIRHKEQRQHLADLIGPGASGDIKFVVVGEPPENKQDLDCVDIGYARVNAKKLLRNETDIVEKNIDVHDVNNDQEIIGQMNVTVEIVQALRFVQNRMQE